MANPFDINASADLALVGGSAASRAVGVENPFAAQTSRPGLSIPPPSSAVPSMAELASRRALATAPEQSTPMVGFNASNNTFFSRGKVFSLDNLSEADAASQAGYLAVNNPSDALPPGYYAVESSKIAQAIENGAKARGAVSAAKEVGRQAVAGLAVDVPAMLHKAGAYLSPAGSAAEKGFGEAAKYWEDKAQGWTPDVYGRGAVADTLITGARALAPSALGMGATLVNPVAGGAAVLGAFGGSQAWDTYQKALAAGKSPDEARALANQAGAIEGAGEVVADIAGGRLLKHAGSALSGVGRGGVPAAMQAAKDPRWIAKTGADLLANAGVQAGTEYAQGYGVAALEKGAGIAKEDPHEQGLHGFKGGLGMSLLLAPFGVHAGWKAAQQRREVEKVLADPSAPAELRALAADRRAEMLADMVGQEQASAWRSAFTASEQNREQDLLQPKPFAPAPESAVSAPQQPAAPVPPQTQVPTSPVTQAAQSAPVSEELSPAAEQQAVSQLTQQQADREAAYERYGITTPDNQTKGNLFGQPLFGPKVAEVGTAVAELTKAMDQVKTELTQAVAQANAETGNQLIKFAWNANNTLKSVQAAFGAIDKVLDKYQISHVQSVDEAATILNSLSDKAKGAQLEQIDAIYNALTGGHTAGYEASQTPVVKKKPAASVAAPPADNLLGLQAGEQPPVATVTAPQATGAQNEQPAPAIQQPAKPGVAAGLPQVAVTPAIPQGSPAGMAEVPATYGEADPGEAALDQIETIVRDALKLTIPVQGRATPQSTAKRREYILLRLTGTEWNSTEEAATAFGVTEATVKNWERLDVKPRLEDPTAFFAKLGEAIKALATEQGIDPRAVLEQAAASRIARAATAEELVDERVDTGQGTSRTETPLESDTQVAELPTEAEVDAERAGTAPRAVAEEGLTTQGRKSASLQEQFNAVETNQAKYLALTKKLEDAENRGDDAEVDRLNAELARVIEQATKQDQQNKRRVRAKAGVDEDTGGQNAVQKRSPAKVDVRKRAGDGETVGEGNAQQAAAGEKAAQVWDETASEYPQAPKWADLTDEQRQDFIDYGEENWTPDDVRTELVKLAKTRFVQTDLGDIDPSLKGVVVRRTALDELEDEYPAIGEAMGNLRDAGLGYLIRRVGSWHITTDNTRAFGAAFTHIEGMPAVILNVGVLDKYNTEHFVAHELGHLADTGFVTHVDQVFSAMPQMRVVRNNDGSLTGVGNVAKEIIAYAAAHPKSAFADTMKYPLARKQMNREDTQAEMFAQLWAIWASPHGKDFLSSELPYTAVFMEVAYEITKTQQAGLEARVDDAGRRRAVAQAIEETTTRLHGPRGPSAVPVRFGEGVAFSGRALDQLPTQLKRPVDTVWTGLFRNAALPLALTADVVKMASKYMRSASDYLKAQYERQATRLRIEATVERILQRFDKLDQPTQKKVNELIYDSTMQQKWAFYPGEHRVGTSLLEISPELEARFNALPTAAQAIVKDVFEHGYQMLRMKQAAVNAAIDREFAERERAAAGDQDMLDELAKEKSLLKKREERLRNTDISKPYAYLARYGDYIVVAKSKEFKHYEERAKLNDFDVKDAKRWLEDNVSNPDHYVVQFAETQGEADKIAAGLIASGKFDMDGTEAGPKEHQHSFIGGDAFMAVKRLRTQAERGGEVSAELSSALSNLYLATVAEASARKSEIQRKYVAGADKNMMRNLATSGRADAHFVSAVQHNDSIVDALERMRKEAAGNRRAAMPIYNELYARYAKGMDYSPQGGVSRGLTQLSTLWYLSTSPAFYLQQILQTSVLSLPFMAGRLGYFRSVRAIKGAYDDVLGMVKGLGVNDHVDFAKAPADVRGMLETLVGMGKIDISIDADAKARSGDNGALDKVMHKLQGVNTRVETINRATAAIAAYRGYLQRYGADKVAQATQYAADVVSNTHGSYDGFNTPRVLSSDVGRVVGQFKRFQIIQLSMLAKLIHTSFKGASHEERVVARSALRFLTAHMAVLGGALGVPFVSQFGNILLGLFGSDDEPKDLEHFLRRAIGNDTAADMLLRGVPASVGLESLGKKLAMENVASLLPFADVDFASRSGMEKMIVALLGPTANLSLKAADAIGLIGKGDYYKGLEQAMPTGIANAMKGYRFANEGVTMRSGDTVLSPSDVTLLDAAFQSVGLPTTAITDRQRIQSLVANYDKFYQERAAEIKQEYAKAHRKADTEAMQEAREEWMRLQDARVQNGYTRQPMSSLFKAPMEQMKRERGVVGGVETTRGNRRFVESLVQ